MIEASASRPGENRSALLEVPVPAVPMYPSRRELRAAQTTHSRKHAKTPAKAPAKQAMHRSAQQAAPKALHLAVTRIPSRLAAPKKTVGKRAHSRVIVMMAMLFAPGMFVTLALPAYAYSPASAAPTQNVTGSGVTQSLVAGGGVQIAQVTRDSFTATSGQQLQNLQRSAARAAQIAAYTRSGAQALGDDYPWPVEPVGVVSPLGYFYRECVDFVAWRLNRDAGSTSAPYKYVWANLTPLGGDASQWARNWKNNGWPTSTVPVAGSVAWWSYHIAYVKQVLGDGNVVLEEYNLAGTHRYDMRTVPASSVALYLYPPPR